MGRITEKILLIIVKTPSKCPGLLPPHNFLDIEGAFIDFNFLAKLS